MTPEFERLFWVLIEYDDGFADFRLQHDVAVEPRGDVLLAAAAYQSQRVRNNYYDTLFPLRRILPSLDIVQQYHQLLTQTCEECGDPNQVHQYETVKAMVASMSDSTLTATVAYLETYLGLVLSENGAFSSEISEWIRWIRGQHPMLVERAMRIVVRGDPVDMLNPFFSYQSFLDVSAIGNAETTAFDADALVTIVAEMVRLSARVQLDEWRDRHGQLVSFLAQSASTVYQRVLCEFSARSMLDGDLVRLASACCIAGSALSELPDRRSSSNEDPLSVQQCLRRLVGDPLHADVVRDARHVAVNADRSDMRQFLERLLSPRLLSADDQLLSILRGDEVQMSDLLAGSSSVRSAIVGIVDLQVAPLLNHQLHSTVETLRSEINSGSSTAISMHPFSHQSSSELFDQESMKLQQSAVQRFRTFVHSSPSAGPHDGLVVGGEPDVINEPLADSLRKYFDVDAVFRTSGADTKDLEASVKDDLILRQLRKMEARFYDLVVSYSHRPVPTVGLDDCEFLCQSAISLSQRVESLVRCVDGLAVGTVRDFEAKVKRVLLRAKDYGACFPLPWTRPITIPLEAMLLDAVAHELGRRYAASLSQSAVLLFPHGDSVSR
jgi:hypothetical protein